MLKNLLHIVNSRSLRRSPTPPEFFQPDTKEALTFAQAQKLVEVDLEGRAHRINILENLEILYHDSIDNVTNQEMEEKKGERQSEKPKNPKSVDLKKKEAIAFGTKLPEASFRYEHVFFQACS